MSTIKRRQDFLAAARGSSCAGRGVVVQMRRRGDAAAARIGFTVTRKLGNAVTRNRIRRRLREAVRRASGLTLEPGSDYVFIGRAATLERPFSLLMADVVHAAARLNAGKADPARPRTPRGR